MLTYHVRSKWYWGATERIRSNEKYIGDARLQKTVSIDFLTKEKKKNIAQAPQYYVENGYEAMVAKSIWKEVQSSWIRAGLLLRSFPPLPIVPAV